jgi:hypothetical protein
MLKLNNNLHIILSILFIFHFNQNFLKIKNRKTIKRSHVQDCVLIPSPTERAWCVTFLIMFFKCLRKYDRWYTVHLFIWKTKPKQCVVYWSRSRQLERLLESEIRFFGSKIFNIFSPKNSLRILINQLLILKHL